MDERICKVCGSTFIPKTSSQLCCSEECSQENKRLWQSGYFRSYKKDIPVEMQKDIPQKNRKGVCCSYCNGCVFMAWANGNLRVCEYYFRTNQRRPCPAGKGCTVKKTVTKEEREAASAQKRREWLDKQKAKRTITVVCAVCGKEFQTTDTRKKYCSPECFYKNRRQVWSEREERRKKVSL